MIEKIINSQENTITDIDELVDTVQLLQTEIYHGYDEHTQPYSWLWATQNKNVRIRIQYDDIYDCKKTELALKPICTKFSPRKYVFNSMKSIGLSEGCKRELGKLKENYESYEMVIWKLLLEHYGKI